MGADQAAGSAIMVTIGALRVHWAVVKLGVNFSLRKQQRNAQQNLSFLPTTENSGADFSIQTKRKLPRPGANI